MPLVRHQYMEVEERFTEGLDFGILMRPSHFVNMNVVIPLFQLQTSVDLCQALALLGMRDPFDSDRADFSGINNAEQLHIEGGSETSFLQVSKNGVRFQSVAALNLATNKRSYRHPDLFDVPELHWQEPKDEEVKSFVVNQPFSVIIVDRESESILYNARVKVPQPASTSD